MPVSYISPKFQALDDDGRPIVGGRLFTYQNKSTTLAATYLDAGGEAPNANPILLDGRGEATVFLDGDQVYTFLLYDEYGALVWSQDDIAGAASQHDFNELAEGIPDLINVETTLKVNEKFADSLGELTGLKDEAQVAAQDAADSATNAAQYAGAQRYATESAMRAAQPQAAGVKAQVYADPDLTKRGFYDSNGTVFVFANPQPISSRDLEGKLDRNIAALQGAAFSFKDENGVVGWNQVNDVDGKFTGYTRQVVREELGLLINPAPGIGATVADSNRVMSDLTVDDKTGEFLPFVVDRLAPRIAAALGGSVTPETTGTGEVYPPYSAPIGPAMVMRNGELIPFMADMGKMSGWGSSSQRRLDSAMRVWAQQPGRNVDYYGGLPGPLGGGRDGNDIDQIAARQGGVPALITIPAGSIPPSGPVTVLASIKFRANLVIDGWLSGVYGRLTTQGSSWIFTRSSAGLAVNVSPRTPLISEPGSLYRGGVMLLWAGKNDVGTSGADSRVIDYTHRMFAHAISDIKRVLVLTHFVDRDTPAVSVERDQISAINSEYRRRYGVLVVDVQAYLASSQVWIDTGIAPTQSDLDAQALGNLPPSLAADNQHLIDAVTNAIRDRLILPKFQTLGWY